jgi:hypothetical protein
MSGIQQMAMMQQLRHVIEQGMKKGSRSCLDFFPCGTLIS